MKKLKPNELRWYIISVESEGKQNEKHIKEDASVLRSDVIW